ncbi:hypothetical protein ACTQ49_07960 [Luteococcus sp. Sow4_B9]|uniref:hypothetical protein n=1 Tax=Luteococcus sp. Sow4_B9 TaxID=3438792 RepID=UPI003F977CE0
MTEPRNSQKDLSAKANDAKHEAEKVGKQAKDQAGEVSQTAVQDAQQVIETAKGEAQQVAAEAQDHIRQLLDTTVGEFRGRASEGQNALASTVRSLSDELSQMTGAAQNSGPVAQFTGELASRGDSVAGWLENHEPDDLVFEVRRFAARRPGTFLAVAAGAGLLAGRLARGTRAVTQEQPNHELANPNATDALFDQERPDQYRGDAR